MFKIRIDEDPDDWRRCEADGKLVRVRDKRALVKHLGHRLQGCDGFHINELIRYWLGWL